jgi:hypothetical protein
MRKLNVAIYKCPYQPLGRRTKEVDKEYGER